MKEILKKTSCNFEIVEKNDQESFTIIKKSKKITIYDKKMIENTIDKQFNQNYRKLLYIITDIINSDDATDSDIELLKLKIDNLRQLILNKYYKFISKELLNKYLKMIMILEDKAKIQKKHRGR